MVVPFHSQYLEETTDKAIYEDLNDEELWTFEGLRSRSIASAKVGRILQMLVLWR